MRAAVRVAPRRIEIVERPAPEPAPGEVLIRITQVALCGGDLHYFRGPMPMAAAIPGYADEPRIVCHEALGTVVDAPAGSGLEPGDLVTIDPQRRCGTCPDCLAGDIELCPQRRDMGYSADGAAAELVAVPAERVFVVPREAAERAASATHGLAAVLHALSRVNLAGVRSALVAGPGPAGLMFTMALLAKLDGGRVAMLGRPSPRLDIATAVGAEAIALDDDVWAGLRHEWGTDSGFDLVVDAIGAPDIVESLQWCVRPKGTLLLYAPTVFALDGNVVFRRELNVVGSTGATGGMPEAIELIASGRVPLERIVTHTFAFEQIQDAFELATAPAHLRGDLLKAVVQVG